MTATQLIGEIVALPLAERRQVISFTRRLEAEESLIPEELSALADKLAGGVTDDQAAPLREQILKGFYGSH